MQHSLFKFSLSQQWLPAHSAHYCNAMLINVFCQNSLSKPSPCTCLSNTHFPQIYSTPLSPKLVLSPNSNSEFSHNTPIFHFLIILSSYLTLQRAMDLNITSDESAWRIMRNKNIYFVCRKFGELPL